MTEQENEEIAKEMREIEVKDANDFKAEQARQSGEAVESAPETATMEVMEHSSNAREALSTDLVLRPFSENELPAITATDHERALINSHFGFECPDWCVGFHFHRAKQLGLDPFSQMSVIRFGAKWTSTINIHGLRGKAQATGQVLGIDTEMSPNIIDVRKTMIPEWIEVTVTRLVAGQRAKFAYKAWATEWFKPTNNPKQDNWRQRPIHMLTIRAETHAMHRAFPEQFIGMMETSEIQDAADLVAGSRKSIPELAQDDTSILEKQLWKELQIRDTGSTADQRQRVTEKTLHKMRELSHKNGRSSVSYQDQLRKTIAILQGKPKQAGLMDESI